MMKQIFKGTDYSVYQCDTCGQKIYIPEYFKDEQPPLCPRITCKEYGFSNAEYTKEEHNKVYDLRQKYLGTIYNKENRSYIIIGISNLDSIIVCDMVCLDFWLMPTRYLKAIEQCYLQ